MNVEDYNSADAQLHVASQMIALTGKNLVPAQPDDSHTTAIWDDSRNLMIGRQFELSGANYQVFVDPINFGLAF